MICEPCSEQRHDDCDDKVRYEGYVRWLRATYGGKGKPVVGLEENKIIHANRPYDSCPCQHKGIPHRLVRSNLTSDHCERCLLDWPCPSAQAGA